MGQRVPYMGKAFPWMGKQFPTDGKGDHDMEVNEQHAALPSSYAMSWEDVRERFPYGLPASLQQGGWGANVIVLEEWRRHHRQGAGSKWGGGPGAR
jgi:hypothetical protein